MVQKIPDACILFGVSWCLQCATNEVLQFFVCCGTFVPSVGLLFFNAELVFSQAMSLSPPCEEFQF